MKYAWVVIKSYSFGSGFQMHSVYIDEREARLEAIRLNSELPEEDRAEHDDYGQVSGIEFVAIPVELK